MYEERKDKFSIKDLVLQILFISLFVFLLLWLFPTKSDVSRLKLGASNNGSKDTNTVLYDRIFNENIIAMKDAAKSYYTNPRLPQTVGDKVKITLGEMLAKKIILPFTDKNGKTCDEEKSYVEITKENDDEYIMKVNLKCSDEENYLLVYMGCYDYCTTTVCEKNKEDVSTPIVRKVVQENKPNVVNNVTNITNIIINQVCPDCCPTPTPTPTPTPPDPAKEYICEYLKVTNGKFTEWSTWSDWSDKEQYATQLKQVKSKTVKTTVDQKILTGYNVTTYRDSNKPIYKQVQVQSGTRTEKVCASYGTRVEETGSYAYGEWKDEGLVKLYNTPQGSDTVRYILVSSGTDNCENCSYRNYNVYRKQTRTRTVGTRTVTYCTAYDTKTIPLYKTVNVLTGYGTSEKRDPIYKTVQSVVNKKYYSYRTRRVTSGSRDVKWDVCEGSTLVNNGYSPTGNKKEK